MLLGLSSLSMTPDYYGQALLLHTVTRPNISTEEEGYCYIFKIN